jgi:putative molybdopterin biosynthesis protein
MRQEQFLHVLDRDEAEHRFQAALDLRPLPVEGVPLAEALNRVLAQDVLAPVDVPGFDRSNVDGFAVRAADTFGASETCPAILGLSGEALATGQVPAQSVTSGLATPIATGAIVPRGADSVVMIEHTDAHGQELRVCRPVTPGANITFAGTDIGRGETVLRRGDLLTSRETGVLAALGLAVVPVVRRPRVAILSTGDEIIPPGAPHRPGLVYDSNATILADAVREQGGEPVPLGIVPDDRAALEQALRRGLSCDVVLLSGGTSKGAGDLSYRVVAELGPPGVLAHGVALKPGKPLCLAAVRVEEGPPRTVPVVILPGFPTSAVFTFQEFVVPVLRRLAGRSAEARATVQARMAMRVNSERGRTEYLLVSLIEGGDGSRSWRAYPMGAGSGSVTTFSRADGFTIIPRHHEYVEAGEVVEVHLLAQGIRPADLTVIGSHCVGIDYLLGRLQEQGFRTKFLAVGSSGGLAAARRGECDVAGIHLLDPQTNTYNQACLTPDLLLVPGYGRLQGIVYRPGDGRFESHSVPDAVASALGDPSCVLVNRNRGSGTRILVDQLLGSARPPGYWTEARSHHAVSAAVAQGRADWGLTIVSVAEGSGLGFLPVRPEQYDFVIPRARLDRPAVSAFRDLLAQSDTRLALAKRGLRPVDLPS